jgi:putative membrane protein
MNRKTGTLLGLGISIALLAGAIWFLFNFHTRFGYGQGRWIMPHAMMRGGSGMGIIMILLWIVVIGAIALVISGAISGNPSSGNQRLPDAMEILKRRYAKGEIDKEQYQAMKQELQRQ